MNQSFIFRPSVQVVSTWLWFFLLPLSLIALFVGMLQMEMGSLLAWWQSHPYMQAYFETLTAGLLPLLFVWLNKEKLAKYGIRRQSLVKSVGLALVVTAVFFLRSYLITGVWLNHSDIAAELGIAATVWYVLLGIFANGPLEIFFYIFLMEKTDEIFKSGHKLLSLGFWITTVLHSLVHIITTQDVSNTTAVFVIFFFLGLIYRLTKNAMGPMLGWTLINGMVWAYLGLAWLAGGRDFATCV